MKEQSHYPSMPLRARIGLIILVTAIGLLLTMGVVVAQTGPNFDESYKTGPLFADINDVITYTIVAMNTGEAVQDVVLSDTLPGFVTLATKCTYNDGDGNWDCANQPGHGYLWEEKFGQGKRITTTFAVTVNAGTLVWPLVNRAYLSWGSSTKTLVFTTTVNPCRIYLPLTLRQWVAWYQYDTYEPNNTREEAYGPLNSGQSYYSHIYNESDQRDYYYLPLTSSGSIVVNLTVPACCDYDLYLYNSLTGNFVAASNYTGKGLDEQMTYNSAQASATYYILVYSPYKDHSDQEQYQLRATFP